MLNCRYRLQGGDTGIHGGAGGSVGARNTKGHPTGQHLPSAPVMPSVIIRWLDRAEGKMTLHGQCTF